MAIKHKKTELRADSSDAAVVQPSDWNDDHDVGGMLGEFVDLTVAGDTIPYIDAEGNGALLPIVTPAKDFLAGPTTADMRTAIGAIGLDSPEFTGNPTAPTPATGDNSTSVSTTAFVHDAITALIGAAPGALDTLKELADAIGDDAAYAATVAAALALRLRVDAPQSLNSTQQQQGRDNLGLGTAATENVGVAAGNVIQLDSNAKLPAVDASQLTNVPSGATGPGYGGTSTTSLTPETGSKVFTTQAGMAYAIGSRVRATSVGTPAVWMEGAVSAYSGTSLTINVDTIGTATAKADWNFSLAGAPGIDAPSYAGTSTTSLTPATGSKAFTTQAGLAYVAGGRARAVSASAPSVWMEGEIASYSGTTLTLTVDLIGTATAKADWVFTVAGERGQQGAAGAAGAAGPQGPVGSQGIQGIQGPPGTFPTGGGVVGSFALRSSGGSPLDSGGTAAYGGSWISVSLDPVSGVALMQRVA